MDADGEPLSLNHAVTLLLEECRMVLPGVQALFGFQAIAVFSEGFQSRLTGGEQRLHLIALALVAIAVALIMTPAAYHRQVLPRAVSQGFLVLGGRLLLAAMIPLMIGIGIDFYLIARVILGEPAQAAWAAGLLVAFFAGFWFVGPRLAMAKRKGR